MPEINLFVDSDDVAAAQAAGQFTFMVPSDAVKRGNLDDPNDDKAFAKWIQRLEVIESKWYEDTTKAGANGQTYPCIVAEVKFQVAPDAQRSNGEPDPNAGKTHTVWYRVVSAAMKEKLHPKYRANNFALGRMNGLVRAIWGTAAFPHGAKTNLANFYAGTPAPVVGKTIVANVKANRYEGERKDELTDFVPQELTGA